MVYWPRHRLAERQGRRNLQSIYFFLIFPQYFMFFFSKLFSKQFSSSVTPLNANMACFLPFPRLLPVFSQFPGSNKTWPPTFAASRQNSDLSPGSEPHHGAAALEEIILSFMPMLLVRIPMRGTGIKTTKNKLSFPTFNC